MINLEESFPADASGHGGGKAWGKALLAVSVSVSGGQLHHIIKSALGEGAGANV